MFHIQNKKVFNSLKLLARYCLLKSAIAQRGGVLMDHMNAQYWCRSVSRICRLTPVKKHQPKQQEFPVLLVSIELGMEAALRASSSGVVGVHAEGRGQEERFFSVALSAS